MKLDSDFYSIKYSKKTAPISARAERELLIKAKDGDLEACEKLLLANFSVVVSIAKKHDGLNKELSLSDLIQIGYLGLMESIEKYDLEYSGRFSSFASYYIFSSIARDSLPKNVDFNYSFYALELMGKIDQFLDNYYIENEAYPSDEFLYENIINEHRQKGIEDKKYDNFIDILKIKDYKLLRIEDDENIKNEWESVAAGNEINNGLDDLPYLVNCLLSIYAYNSESINSLRNVEMFLSYYGILNYPKKSSDALGMEYGISGTRVRQLGEQWKELIGKVLKPYIELGLSDIEAIYQYMCDNNLKSDYYIQCKNNKIKVK